MVTCRHHNGRRWGPAPVVRMYDEGSHGGQRRSFLRHLKDPRSPEYHQHLHRMVEQYWKPVYCVIRYSWRKDREDACDLTQEFFASVVINGSLVASFSPDAGSFRGYLKGAVTNFM